jgi:hypothetical protein
MTELQKDDILVLDFIINELNKTEVYSINVEYLQKKQVFNFGKKEYKSVDELVFGEEKEFKRLLSIIEEFECAEVNFNKYFNGEHNVSENKKTSNFIKLGGFEKEFEKQQIKSSRESKQDEILDLDVTLKRFESKIGKKLIIAGFIITFLSFVITVLTLEFWQTDESKNERKNQVENSILNKKGEIQKDSLN